MILMAMLIFAASAEATDWPKADPDPGDEAAAEADSASNSESTSDAASEAASFADVAVSTRTLGIGGSTAPRTIQPEGICIMPKAGIFKRGTRWLFGAFEISPTAEFDPECWEKMIAYERAVTERIRAQIAFERELVK
jgi:hypothetical protein